MNRILKLCFKAVPLSFILIMGHLNYALYYQPTFDADKKDVYNKEVYQQLNFLKEALQNGAGDEMQSLFPEGFVFIHALYGLAWVDLIQELQTDSPIFEEGIMEISWTIEEMHAPKASEIFPEDLPLAYGVFYRGWTNLLLGKKLQLQSEQSRDSIEVEFFHQNCKAIFDAFRQSNTPYLASYHGQAWPADMVIAMASMEIHNKLFGVKYKTTIEEWIEIVKRKLDVETGLIPHSVDFRTGKTLEGARGSSQSLMLIFLKDLDAEFAQEQFEVYKKHFLDSRFGLPGIREYPKGNNGRGDVDSGPVILGIGGAASIVGQRTMGKYENWETYEGLRNCIEGFGAAYTMSGKKKYVFGQLPMADAFIAWSNSLEYKENLLKAESNWRWKFQLLSIILTAMFVYLIRD